MLISGNMIKVGLLKVYNKIYSHNLTIYTYIIITYTYY